jgi:hypothetical protein
MTVRSGWQAEPDAGERRKKAALDLLAAPLVDRAAPNDKNCIPGSLVWD